MLVGSVVENTCGRGGKNRDVDVVDTFMKDFISAMKDGLGDSCVSSVIDVVITGYQNEVRLEIEDFCFLKGSESLGLISGLLINVANEMGFPQKEVAARGDNIFVDFAGGLSINALVMRDPARIRLTVSFFPIEE